ncbi:hypothetical protein JEP11_08805 [Proteus mirabilis]|uniref:hypothetical protein n=1 Tax=Enterobacterales TaxID=91347 RepID=UPI000C16FDA0|nr:MULTISPECIES: hypothetical protein [Enterobacterales]EBR1799075.1 hypothetical protein [Salmonella enterica]EBW6709281.1 hypothetical protein [Salmonella enterica subsp. enterica serovar Kentucky]ECR5622861.1 hypothetical protein [Salmonella enterica subsp. enterica serovar Agona]EEB2847308.1 hypothetical protein [Salmonella enterica subsp. enterica serovar Derby]AZG97078.1 hypothetical protein EHQ66_00120 [Proteus mirabilis]
MTDVNLPAVMGNTLPVLDQLTDALGVPRDILASGQEIQTAWNNLPGVMNKIPPALRTEGLARMCVAVAAGLFDSAINYIWNTSVIELREKVKRFGLPVVEQLLSKQNFDEQSLLDLKDADLLNLCLKLNLITEDGYFFLDQCRDIRNNFSAAHPVVGKIDDHEFIGFANRCAKYALGNEHNPVGVDISAFMAAVKGTKFSEEQKSQWVQRIQKTHEAQQYLLFGTLHGIYSDPASVEQSRVNALMIASAFAPHFTPKAKSDLINRHHDYIAKGDEKRHKASQQFFERLGMLSLLGEHEFHSLISNAAKRLLGVHQAMDNFYNEPPFAERLLQLTEQGAIPDTVKEELVTVVITCAAGNRYGVSHAAAPHYTKIIQGFSPSEVEIMLGLPNKKLLVSERIKAHQSCRNRFKGLVGLIDPSSVPTKSASAYANWTK